MTTHTKLIKIEVDQYSNVFVEYTTLDDENFTASTHRDSLYPGQDISNQPEQVQIICSAVWTDEIIEAYQAKLNDSTYL